MFVSTTLQQYLSFTVCAAECEAAEEQSDDEAHTLQVPERSEGKTKVIRQQYLPFTVLKPVVTKGKETVVINVATMFTVYGIETLFDLYKLGNKQPCHSYNYYLKLDNPKELCSCVIPQERSFFCS